SIQEAAEVAPDRIHPRERRRPGRPRREDDAQVSRLRLAPQSATSPSDLADPGGPVPGRLARTPRTAPAQPGPPGQDPLPRPATPLSRSVPRRPAPVPATPDQTVASPRRAAQGGVLRADP